MPVKKDTACCHADIVYVRMGTALQTAESIVCARMAIIPSWPAGITTVMVKITARWTVDIMRARMAIIVSWSADTMPVLKERMQH